MMEEIRQNWNVWNENTVIGVSIDVTITGLSFYPAGFHAAQFWRHHYKALSLPLVCQDCVLVDMDGLQLTVTTHPSLATMTRLEGSFARITGLMIVTLADQKVVIITSWTDTEPFELQFKRLLTLTNYGDQVKPLCHPSCDTLCPWTASHFQWTNVKILPLKHSVMSLLGQLQYSYQLHNLKRLNLTWSHAGKEPPLLVRVLAKSKERLIMQQDNHRKSWMCLTNLLVADNSGYCIMTVWDTAVPSFQIVKEGDILALGRYSVGRMRPSHRKIIHNLAPKVRLAIDPTEIEIKVNQCDLDTLTIVHSGAVCDTVPPLLTCFTTIDELTRNRVSDSRLVDIVGMVAWHGRWEREGSYKVGQYWVRVWLRLLDHSSFDSSTTPTAINVKLFTDQESWKPLKEALPGEVVILTNMLTVYQADNFSHLESSNQTGIFTAESASDSRFRDVEEVQQFRNSLDTHQDQYIASLKTMAGLGGQFCCGQSFHQIIQILTTAESEIVNANQLSEALQKLQIYGSKRLLVLAKLVGLTIYHLKESGESTILERLIPETEQVGKMTSIIGSKTILTCSSIKLISRFQNKSEIETAAQEFCFFNKKPTKEENQLKNVNFRETTIGMATLILGDMKIYTVIEQSNLEELQSIEASHYMLDCFRFEPVRDSVGVNGVEFVLRHAATLETGSQSEQTFDQSMNQSLLNTTEDMANALL